MLALLGDNLWAEIDLNEIPSPLEDVFGALLTDISWPKITDADGNVTRMVHDWSGNRLSISRVRCQCGPAEPVTV